MPETSFRRNRIAVACLCFLLLFLLLVAVAVRAGSESDSWWSYYVRVWLRLDTRSVCDHARANRYMLAWFNFAGPPVEKIAEPVYAINLPQSAARRRHIMSQAREHGLNLHLFPGVDGRDAVRSDDGRTVVAKNWSSGWTVVARAASRGGQTFSECSDVEIACTLSHCLVILNVALGDMPAAGAVVVVEDDVSFGLRPSWTRSISDLARAIGRDDSGVDFLSIYRSCNESHFAQKSDAVSFEDYTANCSGNVAYMFTARAARVFASKFARIDAAKKLVEFSLRHGQADVFVPQFALPRSFVVAEGMIVPSNDTGGLESTIHPWHTLGHVARAGTLIRRKYEEAASLYSNQSKWDTT